MKNVITSLVAVAGLSVAATAAVNSRVDLLVSTNGTDFSPNVSFNANSGMHNVEVLVRVSYTGTAAPVGLASLVIQPTVSNWTASDTAAPIANAFGSNTTTPPGVVADAPGQYGRISPWGRTALASSQALTAFVHTGGSGGAPAGTWLRIAQKQITSWFGGVGNTSAGSGVNLAQVASVGRFTSDPAFNPSLQNVDVFRFGLTIDTSSGVRDLSIDIPTAGFGNLNSSTGDREVYWFDNMNESSGSIRGTAAVNAGGIHVIPVPAPASAALLGLGGLCVARRRRQA
jgi:hypothetical protein